MKKIAIILLISFLSSSCASLSRPLARPEIKDGVVAEYNENNMSKEDRIWGSIISALVILGLTLPWYDYGEGYWYL
jgi:uncharacterized protein YceK